MSKNAKPMERTTEIAIKSQVNSLKLNHVPSGDETVDKLITNLHNHLFYKP